MSELNRREALGAMGAMVFGAAAAPALRERFHAALAAGQQPVFFSDSERALMSVLADMVIPADDKSGSATDSGAMPYIEFVLSDSNDRSKTAWHGGLAWFDAESQRRFQQPFVNATDAQRGQILDDIAFPARASDQFKDAAAFFNRVRDLVGSAFFSSSMGVEDLGYQGGVMNPSWLGAPPEAIQPLGVSYDEWNAKYGHTQAPAPRRAPRSHE